MTVNWTKKKKSIVHIMYGVSKKSRNIAIYLTWYLLFTTYVYFLCIFPAAPSWVVPLLLFFFFRFYSTFWLNIFPPAPDVLNPLYIKPLCVISRVRKLTGLYYVTESCIITSPNACINSCLAGLDNLRHFNSIPLVWFEEKLQRALQPRTNHSAPKNVILCHPKRCQRT